MRPDPFPSPGWDGEEPDGSLPPAATGTGPDAGDPGEGPAQGLFVCLPAEDLDVARFAQHGQSDAMPPGPLLASVVHALTGEDGAGLAALSDDQLVGIISAARRMESRAAWTQMAAMREFAARRSGSALSEFAADELAYELQLDPDAARKRKEAARREAHVRRFREDSGNAGMVARELPSDEVLASWQRVEQRALDLRAAGMPGTLQELRVRAYLDLPARTRAARTGRPGLVHPGRAHLCQHAHQVPRLSRGRAAGHAEREQVIEQAVAVTLPLP